MVKTAFITGISGQDGAYLAEFLIGKGYRVVGGDRRTASGSLWRLKELGIVDKVEIVEFELAELTNIYRVFENYEIDELYHLAAQSFVGASFELPLMTSDITGLGVTRVLEGIRKFNPAIKFYQASTSEMYGNLELSPANENSSFRPRSPYGISKLYAYWITVNYREAYGIFACNGILFNHESPLRGEEFVTRKITLGIADYFKGKRNPLQLGNLSARRDWGFAGDYVPGMWMMLQQENPDDYVLASGTNHSVREFVEVAFKCIDIKVKWEGECEDERGFCSESGDLLVEVNSNYYRPSEIDALMGDSSKAHEKFGWAPKTSFNELVEMMVRADCSRS